MPGCVFSKGCLSGFAEGSIVLALVCAGVWSVLTFEIYGRWFGLPCVSSCMARDMYEAWGDVVSGWVHVSMRLLATGWDGLAHDLWCCRYHACSSCFR